VIGNPSSPSPLYSRSALLLNVAPARAMTVLRRVAIGKEAPGQFATRPGALHIRVCEQVPDDDAELVKATHRRAV
jgi:hypothetical protein